MNGFITIDEAIRERESKCSQDLAVNYLQAIRPIYGSTPQETPTHIGSCILVEINRKKLLLTAAHIIDENKYTTLYVAGKKKLIKLEGGCDITNLVNGSREKDKFDFAILELSESITSELGEVRFIQKNEIMTNKVNEPRGKYLALGYPNSKNKKPNNKDLLVTQNPFIYSSSLKLEEKLFKEIGVNKSTHYLLDFCHKHSTDSDGIIVNSIYPKGVSGGGLFLIEGMTSPENYKPTAECSGKLIAVIIEYHKKQKVILATRINQILKTI